MAGRFTTQRIDFLHFFNKLSRSYEKMKMSNHTHPLLTLFNGKSHDGRME